MGGSKNNDTDLPASKQVSLASQTRSSYSTTNKGGDLAFATAPVDLDEITPSDGPARPRDTSNPWPDLSGEPALRTDERRLPHRNPWLMRTTFSHPVMLPPVAVPSFLKKKPAGTIHEESLSSDRGSRRTRRSDGSPDGEGRNQGEAEMQWTESPNGSRVHTRVVTISLSMLPSNSIFRSTC